MKKFCTALLACCLAVGAAAASAFATTPEPFATDLANPRVQQALLTTQMLAAAICHEHANLSPEVLTQNSSAFAFILGVQAIGVTPKDIAGNPGLLAKRISSMKCGDGGVLQFDAAAS